MNKWKWKFTIVVVALFLVTSLAQVAIEQEAIQSSWESLFSPKRQKKVESGWEKISVAEAYATEEKHCPEIKTEIDGTGSYEHRINCNGIQLKIVDGNEAWVKKS